MFFFIKSSLLFLTSLWMQFSSFFFFILHKPEIIFHLASEAIVINSYKNIFKTFKTNVNYTINIFEIFKTEKYIKKIIIFTSDKVYKNNSNTYLSENDALGGDDPYSCSKSCQDLVAQMYQKQIKEKIIHIKFME